MEVQEEVYPSAERADGGDMCNSDSHLFAEMQWQTVHHCDPWRSGGGAHVIQTNLYKCIQHISSLHK